MTWKTLIYLFILFPLMGNGQTYISHTINQDGVVVRLSEGVLRINPVHKNAVRVQWIKNLQPEEREFVLVNRQEIPKFKCSENKDFLKLKSGNVTVLLDKKNSRLTFLDKKRKVLLSEAINSRKLTNNTVSSEPCYIAEQGFETRSDEYLFGLGQFQDGHYNLKNISRKLIQVNSQIALPFLYCSKG